MARCPSCKVLYPDGALHIGYYTGLAVIPALSNNGEEIDTTIRRVTKRKEICRLCSLGK